MMHDIMKLCHFGIVLFYIFNDIQEDSMCFESVVSIYIQNERFDMFESMFLVTLHFFCYRLCVCTRFQLVCSIDPAFFKFQGRKLRHEAISLSLKHQAQVRGFKPKP